MKIAAFDFDWTLVRPISDQQESMSKNDWTWLFSDIKDVFLKLRQSGYIIMVISDQRKKYKKEQVREALRSLTIPHIGIVIGEGKCRKPNKDLFPFHLKDIDSEMSFYVGDEGGEAYDPSNVDKQFAHNVGISYVRPEHIFRGAKSLGYGLDLENPKAYVPIHDQPEVIIMMGHAASGKTTYVKKHLVQHGFNHVESNAWNTKTNVNRAIAEALRKHEKIVVDAMHPKKLQRDEIRGITRRIRPNAKITIIWMNTPRVISWNYNVRRPNSLVVPESVYHVFEKHFDKPTADEDVFQVYLPFPS